MLRTGLFALGRPLAGANAVLRNQLRLPFAAHTLRSYATAPATPTNTEELVKYKASYIRPSAEELKPLREAPKLYARIHVHQWNLLVTKGDLVKLPVNLKDVKLGDVLNFNEVSELGSRQFTLSGGENGRGRIDPSVFSIRGVVVEKSRVKRSVDEKTRRRRRHVRHVVANNSLTTIRVSELELK